MKLTKKIVSLTLALGMLTTTAFAGDVNIIANGEVVDQDSAIVDGRTLIPVRGVFETLGFEVGYDAVTKTATLTNDKDVVIITAGMTTFDANGNTITPDVPQQIINDRFMLPLRAIGEAIGAEVNWDAETKTATITYDNGMIDDAVASESAVTPNVIVVPENEERINYIEF